MTGQDSLSAWHVKHEFQDERYLIEIFAFCAEEDSKINYSATYYDLQKGKQKQLHNHEQYALAAKSEECRVYHQGVRDALVALWATVTALIPTPILTPDPWRDT